MDNRELVRGPVGSVFDGYEKDIRTLTDALLELRELAASGSAEMAIIDEALAATTTEAPWSA